MFFRNWYNRPKHAPKRPSYPGRWPETPPPILEGPHNAPPRRAEHYDMYHLGHRRFIEESANRLRGDPWTTTQLMLVVVVVGLLAAIALTTDWQRFWSLLR